eukprot:3602536-Pyramimonas_sp.AAC.1
MEYTGSGGTFSRRTNQTQKVRVHRSRRTNQTQERSAGIFPWRTNGTNQTRYTLPVEGQFGNAVQTGQVRRHRQPTTH